MTDLDGFADGATAYKQVKAIRFLCTAIRIERAIGMPAMKNKRHIHLTANEQSELETVRARGYHVGCGTTAREVRAHGYVGAADVVAVLRSLVDYKGPPLLYYYAAHDTTLMAVMSLFGYTNFIIPEFAAFMVVEKSRDTVLIKYMPRPDVDLVGDSYRLPIRTSELADMPTMRTTRSEQLNKPDDLSRLLLAINYCPVCDGPHMTGDLTSMTQLYVDWLQTRRCAACGKSDPTNACSNCKRVSYCDATCQKNDWQRHQAMCIKIM
jgi:hypothetical protein